MISILLFIAASAIFGFFIGSAIAKYLELGGLIKYMCIICGSIVAFGFGVVVVAYIMAPFVLSKEPDEYTKKPTGSLKSKMSRRER